MSNSDTPVYYLYIIYDRFIDIMLSCEKKKFPSLKNVKILSNDLQY